MIPQNQALISMGVNQIIVKNSVIKQKLINNGKIINKLIKKFSNYLYRFLIKRKVNMRKIRVIMIYCSSINNNNYNYNNNNNIHINLSFHDIN